MDPRAARPGPYPRPSDSEFEHRRALLAGLLETTATDALLFYGHSGAQHDIRYLTAWPPGWDSYATFAPRERPRLYVPSPNHVPTAEAMSGGLAEVGSVGRDAAATLAADLRRAFREGHGRVGLVAPLPYPVHAGLLAALPGVELVDVTQGFRELRLRKSPEEVAWTRRAARLCDLAMAALVDAARPGMRDDELVAVVEGAYRRAGGEHGICFLASVPMRGGGRIVPAQYPARRRIRSGDAIVIELSAGLAGFTGQVLRTIAVGDPPARFRRLHAVAEEAFASIAALVRPGATAADLLQAARLIDEAGMTVVDDVVHGYGGGYLPPVLRTPATQTRLVPDLTLEPGMMLVVQPNVVSPDRRTGVQTGELLVVRDGGHDHLHRVRRGLLLAGS